MAPVGLFWRYYFIMAGKAWQQRVIVSWGCLLTSRWQQTRHRQEVGWGCEFQGPSLHILPENCQLLWTSRACGEGWGLEFHTLNVAMANGYWLHLRPVSQEGSGHKKLFFFLSHCMALNFQEVFLSVAVLRFLSKPIRHVVTLGWKQLAFAIFYYLFNMLLFIPKLDIPVFHSLL